MAEQYSIQRLLSLRKLTRSISDLLRGQVKEYVTTLAPLLRPRMILGDYVTGGGKDAARAPEKAFKDLQALYENVAASKTFNLARELNPPVEVASTTLEITPVEYVHEARSASETKTVLVTSPLKWMLNYAGYSHGRVKELLGSRNTDPAELRRLVIHCCVLHTVFTRQPGLARIFEALRFGISSTKLPELGELPITMLSSTVPTVRPPDDVLIASTELSGTNAFEEVVDVEAISSIGDPLREALVQLARSAGEKV